MRQIRQIAGALGALAAGAGAMYYLDPQQGSQRRARVGDKLRHAAHETRDYSRARIKRMADRGRGLVASLRTARRSGPVSDPQLNERVRARLGRVVSRPHAVETHVTNGIVELRGPISADDLPPLMAALWAVPGVRGIDNHLAVHDESGSAPVLQGGTAATNVVRRPRRRLLIPFVVIAAPIAVALGLAASNQQHAASRR